MHTNCQPTQIRWKRIPILETDYNLAARGKTLTDGDITFCGDGTITVGPTRAFFRNDSIDFQYAGLHVFRAASSKRLMIRQADGQKTYFEFRWRFPCQRVWYRLVPSIAPTRSPLYRLFHCPVLYELPIAVSEALLTAVAAIVLALLVLWWASSWAASHGAPPDPYTQYLKSRFNRRSVTETEQ